MPADQQVELLVGAAELDVGLERDRVVALHQRIQELVHRDRLPGLVALGEIVALEHAGDRVLGRELDHARGAHGAEPPGIEVNDGLFGVQDLEDLVLVGPGVGLHFLRGQARAGGVLAGGVADHPGEIADQEDGRVPQLLELAHLVDEHGVAEVQVRRGRVEARLDPQRLAAGQLLRQVGLGQELGGAAAQFLELLCRRQHRSPLPAESRGRAAILGAGPCLGNRCRDPLHLYL